MKEHFSRFFAGDPERLHFAAHSHHPWPDVALEAHNQYWLDSARLADDKWEYIFGQVVPRAQSSVASVVGLASPETLTFAPNTHDFLVRIFSCLEPPVRILSTSSEFHSFNRQSRRWEEAGLAIVDRIESEPFATFNERFLAHLEAGVHDLVYISSVFFDSGFVVEDMEGLVEATPNHGTHFVIDGYHQFMALPTNLGPLQDRAFFVAGGYKYAMSGEGVCFLHSPPGYGARPVDTGWYAGFGQLESGVGDVVGYGTDGSRFAGATYDPSGIYRLDAVLQWLSAMGLTPESIHNHVVRLQSLFLESDLPLGEVVPPPGIERGNFLTFRSEHALDTYHALHDAGVVTDYRGDRLRLGFGIYQDETDIERLVDAIRTVL
ncbi:MAG TPA: aminotransferase class V-fold PLP-dependent enzyme [Acidimicrobiia bacterium]